MKDEVTIHCKVLNVQKVKGEWRSCLCLLDRSQPIPGDLPIEEKHSFSVSGELGSVDEGDSITCVGRWNDHWKYGLQFKARMCFREIGKNDQDLVTFLWRAGLMRGEAGQLVRAHGREKVIE